MSQLLHEPTIRLRSLSQARGRASLELVRELFGLRDEPAEARVRPHPPSSPRSTTSSATARLMRIGTAAARSRLRRRAMSPSSCEAHPPHPPARSSRSSRPGTDLRRRRARGRERAAAERPRVEDKSRWVDTIEQALLAGEIDLAVPLGQGRAGRAGRGPVAARGARTGGGRGRALRRANARGPPRVRTWARAACATPRSCVRRARTCAW